MVENNIGKQIVELRKRDKITQEQLGTAIGVSGQAVSKWESGRCPDIGLIPAIADHFDVTIDYLFGVDSTNKFDIGRMIINHLSNLKSEERFEAAMQLCWDIFNGIAPSRDKENTYDDLSDIYSEDEVFGYIIEQAGIARILVNQNNPSFFIFPESKNGYNYLLEAVRKEEYLDFFRCMSSRDFFDSVVFVMGMENESYFTRESLMGYCDISAERTTEILELLKKYHLIQEKNLRIDGKNLAIYSGDNKINYSELLGVLSFTKGILRSKGYFCKLVENRSKTYFDNLNLTKGGNKDEIHSTPDEGI